MNDFNPYLIFPEFYNNPLIQRIKNSPKWTISDKNKRPIDMQTLKRVGKIKGAEYTNQQCLMTLPELCDFIPDASNHAFYLDALKDGFVVLDIEPKCPEVIKRKMLSFPYLYGEISMSGKGIHLLFLLPECIKKYPAAQKKVVLKEENGFYEILMNHYVTFTRRTISPYYNIPDETNRNAFIKLFEQMAKEQIEISRENISIENMKPNEIPMQDFIIDILMHQNYRKNPENFANDMSKYEYAYIGYLHYKLKMLLTVDTIQQTQHQYTVQEKAWLLYYTAREKIPYRPKHEEKRYGLPWLLYLCREVIAKNVE